MASFGGPIAQRLEQGTHNPLVAGSNPAGPRRLTKVVPTRPAYTKQTFDVIILDKARTGSNPVAPTSSTRADLRTLR